MIPPVKIYIVSYAQDSRLYGITVKYLGVLNEALRRLIEKSTHRFRVPPIQECQFTIGLLNPDSTVKREGPFVALDEIGVDLNELVSEIPCVYCVAIKCNSNTIVKFGITFDYDPVISKYHVAERPRP